MRICVIEDCDRKHYARGWCHKHYAQWWAVGDPNPTRPWHPTGSEHSNWAGDDATYSAVHWRLKTWRGPPSAQHCVCGSRAKQWAYTHSDPDERHDDLGRPYSTNLTLYVPMCVPCHVRLDRRH